MTEQQQNNSYVPEVEEEQSVFSLKAIYDLIILNWQWFVLSTIICLGIGYLYLRYTTPVHSVVAKILIKDDGNNKMRRPSVNGLESMTNLGTITTGYGIENEQEILKSSLIASQAVRNLKLYVSYWGEGRVKDHIIYKTQPITVDIDAAHLENLRNPIRMIIKRDGATYKVKGEYWQNIDELTANGPFSFEKTFNSLPFTIETKAGTIYLSKNNGYVLEDGKTMKVMIQSPQNVAYRYARALGVQMSGKETSVLNLTFNDANITRAIDYLNQLAICYNGQANEDKNEIAIRTENFINDRLQKISTELNNSDGSLESYKKRNNLIELKIDAPGSLTNKNQYSQKLTETDMQIALINSLTQFAKRPGNKYQVLPSNIGLQDDASTSLINEYNKLVLERNRMLHTASESSPVIEALTSQIDIITPSISQALAQAKKNLEIQRNAIASQYGIYENAVARTPEQERILTQIGREREVTSGLYLMLLQKREENSISLAATADKAKVIEKPQYAGMVSPQWKNIMLIAFVLGMAIPCIILIIINFFRFRIEGRKDVMKLTKLPIIADVAIANEAIKTRADIVVHENENNQMEEIFRSMRTNLQFMLKEHENVIMFTSSTSGEGKTFNCSNLAVSFALLGKKVILVGLDIRKPRLAELFEIKNHHNGITPLLAKDAPTWDDIKEEILPSEINQNLDLLMAGPVPPNPSEIIARPSLKMIIDRLKEKYDYVLIDTAPVGLVTDTLHIGKFANATVFMCRADYTPKACFENLNELANDNKLPNIAVVINGIDMSKKKHGYYYGYGKYGRYSKYGHSYSRYGKYGAYGHYSNYSSYSKSGGYGNKNDNSIKK